MDDLYSFINNKLKHGVIPSFEQFYYEYKYLYDDEQEFRENLKDQYDEALSLEKLRPLLEIPKLEEVKFLSNRIVRIKTSEITYNKKIILKNLEVKRYCQILLIKEEQQINDKSPFCSFTTFLCGKKVRITIIKNFEDKNSSYLLTIRVFNNHPFNFQNFQLANEQTNFIKKSINDKKNILISGKTGSGKTCFLQTLIQFANKKNEYILLIEDLKEIPIESENIVRLATSDFNKPMDQLVSWALRLSPDRLIIGEIRSEEAVSYLNILNTGHQGALTSIHSNSAVESIDRLAFLINFYHHANLNSSRIEIKKLLATYIDIAIHIDDKKVIEVIEIKGTSKEGALYFKNVF